MKSRLRLRRRVIPALALAACMIVLAVTASALAVTRDLRSADAQNAAANVTQAQDLRSPDASNPTSATPSSVPVVQASPAASTVVVDHGGQTLAIVLASTALGIALAGMGFMLVVVYRRPRAWTAPY